MRFPFVWDLGVQGLAMSVSLPYLGKSSEAVQGAVTITDKHGEKLQYDATMADVINIEPFSGASLFQRINAQVNVIVEKTRLDGALGANLFSGSSDNDDVFVWPTARSLDETGPTEEE